MSLRTALSAIGLAAIALLPSAAHAQARTTHATQLWLSAGAGFGLTGRTNGLPFDFGGATTLGLTVQHRVLVGSVRWARTGASPAANWFAGGMLGVGSAPAAPIRGSIAAGLGVAGGPDRGNDLTVPMEVQIGLRLTPVIGLGLTGFAAVEGHHQNVGATFGFQLGRLW
ncbi:MAG: hypothetical protein U0133_17595 [Gemmatimonadales bacterium]